MKSIFLLYLLCISSGQLPGWLTKKEKQYTLYFRQSERKELHAYNILFKKGVEQVADFFSTRFRKHFSVYVHPGRRSLDSTWQTDWKMPGFTSECWMVA